MKQGIAESLHNDVFYHNDPLASVVLIGKPDDSWIMVNAGTADSGLELINVVESRYGQDSRPGYIVLTDAHPDHVGGLSYLLEKWQVPVYAHINEFRFLNGSSTYPLPSTFFENGLLTDFLSVFMRPAVNVAAYLRPLPHHGKLPGLPEWDWITTPGETGGQVSLFRSSDGILI